jgi:hypothetical protein
VRTRRRFHLTLVVLLLGCSQFRVRSRHDPSVDFGRLHTYAWMPLAEVDAADQRVLDRYIDTRIRADAGEALRAKGFRPADSGEPDFWLNYRLATQPAEDVKRDPGRYFSGAGWYGWPGDEGFYSETYDQGTLYIGVVDPRTKHLMWLGAAGARLLPHISFEQRVKRVDAAVKQILTSFPPG